MPKVYSKALNQTIEVNRIIGRIDGVRPGPCLIFIGGIHGNEPSGVFALNEVITELEKKKELISGSLIAISGNLWALERAVRYDKADLNRLWSQSKMEALKAENFEPKNEDEKQQVEIYDLLNNLLATEKGPFYFFDLHTTSADTIPFITVNDSLLNRKFTKQYPVPLILGIEEYLDGPLLSYINELGYVSFGFEAGQHDEINSIKNHKIFILLSAVFAGLLDANAVDFQRYISEWKNLMPNQQSFYELYFRYEIAKNQNFVMKPGFSNFQTIQQNEHLANINQEEVRSKNKSIIFMPLYQSQGSDGYFLIRKIPTFFLWLSRVVRKLKTDRLIVLLPGVKWTSNERDAMEVNLKIARLVTKQLFHLFGYRSKQKDDKRMIIKNREYKSRNNDYKKEDWF